MIVTLAEVRKSYPDGRGLQRVLDGVNLEVKSGDHIAIRGASGSGKSTLLNLIGGLDVRFEGDVVVDGHSLGGLSDRALSRFRSRTVGFVFQSFHLVPELTALDNVALPGWFDDELKGGMPLLRSRAKEALSLVGMDDKAHRLPDHLSGGERQRVAIARALFSRPKLLLCDEPTGNLDFKTGQQVMDVFRRLNQSGITLVMVTHEARVAGAAGRVLRLVEGGLVEETEPLLTELSSSMDETRS